MSGHKVYFTITERGDKKELHCNKDKKLVEDHRAVSKMINKDHPDAVGIEDRWRENMALYGPHMTEI